MQQKMPSRRNPYANLLPLVAGAIATSVVLAACERPDPRQGASQPRERVAQATPSTPAPAVEEQPAAYVPQSSELPPREALTDTVITGKIKAAILTDPGMAGSDVSVITDRGVVALAGVVKNPEQTAIASAHAQRQDGVMRVDNHLSVPPT